MQFKLKEKLTLPLDLSRYHPDIEGRLMVWVNPPVDFTAEEYEKAAEQYNDENFAPMFAWASRIWSQDEDKETHIEVSEIERLFEAKKETDPNLFLWMVRESLELVRRHKLALKKS